jgi:hypothetical protein
VIALDPVGGDAAQRAAQQELRKGAYHRDDPGLASRVLHWFGRRLDWLFSGSPAGSATIVLAVLIAAVVILAVRRAGPPRREPVRAAGALDRVSQLAARDHRDLAEQHAGAERWAEALREWLRACVATLEERGLLDPRPGRTAAEVARAGGSAIPVAAAALRDAAVAFDEVWFGGRPATSADALAGRAAADQVRAGHPAAATPVASGYAVPR